MDGFRFILGLLTIPFLPSFPAIAVRIEIKLNLSAWGPVMPAKKTAKPRGFTDEEKAAMKEYLQERQGVHPKAGPEGESAVLAKIAEMKEPDRSMAKRIHEIIKANAPGLSPRTWYGMPAYANKDGSAVCFFQSGQKFKTRYATLGFTDKARLDEGAFWSVAFAVKELTAAEEAKIVALVKKAAS